MPTDNVTLNAGSGGSTVRTLADASSNEWAACVVTYATTISDGANVLQVVTPSAGLPVSQQGTWTVTATAGTNLNTSALALETGGNLATIAGRTPALGQALAAASVPVVLTAAQLATLTPVSTVSISGTVPVSGTFWQATQPVSGTFWQATQPVSGTLTVNAGTNLNTSALALESGGNLAAIAGAVLSQGSTTSGEKGLLTQAAVTTGAPSYSTGQTSPLSLDTSGNLRVNVAAGGGSGGTSSSFGSSFPATGTAIGAKDSGGSNMAALNLDASGYLKVNVAAGGGAGGTSSSFGSAVPATGTAAGCSDGTNMQLARVFDTDSGAGTEYTIGCNLRGSSSGGSVELATASHPLRTDPTGSTTQPVSGTITANAGTNLNTSLLALEAGGNLATIAGAISSSKAQVNVAQVAGTTTDTNSGNKSAGTQRFVIATDQPALTNALKVDGSGVTQPVSGTLGATQSGTWNVGTVTTVTTVSAVTGITNALPAGTNLIGQVSASGETSILYNGTTALTPKFATIVASSSGATTVVSAVGGKRIRVLRWSLSANGTVNVKWQSHVTPTDITGLHYMIANATAGGAYCPLGIFQTVSGEALDINLSASIAVGGELTYVEV